MPNVTIQNTVSMLLLFNVRLDSGAMQLVKLPAGEVIPNAQYPDDIAEEHLTPYVRDLARNGSLLIQPDESSFQTVTLRFTDADITFDTDVENGEQPIPVEAVTSDGQPLLFSVSVDVRDLLTGTASPGDDYNMVTPQQLTWDVDDPSGTVKNAIIDVTPSIVSTESVEIDLHDPEGAEEGTPNTATITLQAGALE